jgi:hypothetical protein
LWFIIIVARLAEKDLLQKMGSLIPRLNSRVARLKAADEAKKKAEEEQAAAAKVAAKAVASGGGGSNSKKKGKKKGKWIWWCIINWPVHDCRKRRMWMK